MGSVEDCLRSEVTSSADRVLAMRNDFELSTHQRFWKIYADVLRRELCRPQDIVSRETTYTTYWDADKRCPPQGTNAIVHD